MRKETKVGLSLVALLLGVFCFVLYKRIQGRGREAAEALAQQEAVAPMETTQVTAKPVLDGPPRKVADTSSGLMSQAWRQPQRPAGNEARFAQAQPPAAVDAVDPFAGRVASTVDPIAADPVADATNAMPADDRGIVARDEATMVQDAAMVQSEPIAQGAAGADDFVRSEPPVPADDRMAARQPTPAEPSQPIDQPPAATYEAEAVAGSQPTYRETFQAAEPAAQPEPIAQAEPAATQAEPVAASRRYEEPRYEEPRQPEPRHDDRLRDEPPQAGYAARSFEEPAANGYRDQYAEQPPREQFSRAGDRRQDIDPQYGMDAQAGRGQEPYQPADPQEFEREPARGSFAAARFVAQGRPAVAEEVADPATYGGGGDRWHPDRNAAAYAGQPPATGSQPYYDNRAAAGAPPAAQAPAAAPRGQYTVAPNDSFWSISRKLYGDGGFFKALAEHNRRKFPQTRNLKVGDVISAPPAEELRKAYPDLCPKLRQPAPATARTVSSQQRLNAGRIYVVEDGDTLFDIARHELGTPARWVEIFELNADRLSNDFDYIKPGTELVLPADPVRGETRPRENVTRRPGNPTSR